MSHAILLSQIADWHAAREHGKIRDAVLALPEQERAAELICLMARALSNMDDYQTAMEALDSIRAEYADDPYFCVRYGFVLYQLQREHEALDWFRKAREKGLEDIDEAPGTYFPKSVSKWIERAERWAPRRIEKNAFEAQRRANRKLPDAEAAELADFDFEGFWNDCDYSLEKYVGRVPTDADIAETEVALGYRLPAAYKALIKRHNGGLLTKSCFENPLQRDWTPRTYGIESIYGIDRDKPYSLCGDMGARFWVEEWGYPDIGIAIGGCPSGGHDMIFLDYSDCGPQGEPCVVHINQESDYEMTYLADDFGAFVRGLFAEEEDEDE